MLGNTSSGTLIIRIQAEGWLYPCLCLETTDSSIRVLDEIRDAYILRIYDRILRVPWSRLRQVLVPGQSKQWGAIHRRYSEGVEQACEEGVREAL